MSNAQRFGALESREVDLLAAGATYTMERDLYEVSFVLLNSAEIDFIAADSWVMSPTARLAIGASRFYIQYTVPLQRYEFCWTTSIRLVRRIIQHHR